MTPTRSLLALTLLALLSACGGKEEPKAMPEQTTEAAPATTEAPAAETMIEGTPAPGADVDAPALFASRCASCHGEMAEGKDGNPALDKLTSADIQTKLDAYRSGQTMGPKTAIMAPMAKSLTDEQIAALSSYLGS